MKSTSVISMTAAVVTFGLLIGATSSAQAVTCHYLAQNPITSVSSGSIFGDATGLKTSIVCRRAKDHCLWRLRRAWSNGTHSGYGCYRVQ